MTLIKSIFGATILIGVVSLNAHAKMLDFTIERVESVKKYNKVDVKIVTKGLRAYNAFLQTEHVTPGLLAFTNGDKTAATDYQKQIDAYKAKIVQGLKAKHPQERIFTDQAVTINNCYTAAPMGDGKLQMMTDAVQGIVALAKQG